jgi:S-disulfanyl-L-cysteine oxidoreductase SoxD
LKSRYFNIAAARGFLSAAVAVTAAIAQPAVETGPAGSLSFTSDQVANGHAEYIASCVDCHGPDLDDGDFGGPPLKGDAFRAKWFGHPVSSLVAFTKAAMPPDAPGRLPLGTYVEIVAYLLSANGINPGARELPSDMGLLAKLQVPTTYENAGKSR